MSELCREASGMEYGEGTPVLLSLVTEGVAISLEYP